MNPCRANPEFALELPFRDHEQRIRFLPFPVEDFGTAQDLQGDQPFDLRLVERMGRGETHHDVLQRWITRIDLKL